MKSYAVTKPQVGPFLKAARETAGLSQNEVSKKLGLNSGQFVSNVERSVASLPPALVGKIARMYRIEKTKIVEKMTKEYHERLMEIV